MPKASLNINKFDGGMNTESDPRDIAENQFALLSGCYVDKKGIIRTASAKAAEGLTAQDLNNTDYLEGNGFFSFGADYEWDGEQNSDAYFHVINEGEHLFVYDGADSAWESAASGTSEGGGTTSAVLRWLDNDRNLELGESIKVNTEPIYHFADNALRVSDANFDNTTNSTLWIGAINKTFFETNPVLGAVYRTGAGTWTGATNAVIEKEGWFIEPQYIRAPFSQGASGLQSSGVFTDDTCDTNSNTTVNHNENASIVEGLFVTGSGIPSRTYIASITNSTTFVLSAAATSTLSNTELTFGEGRNIWYSDANTTDHDHGDHWPEVNSKALLHGGSVAFTVQESSDGTISESLKSIWYIGVSYIYDGEDNGCEGQESNITTVKMESNDSVNAQSFNLSTNTYPEIITAHFRREHDNASGYYWSPRVTGMRIYISERDTGPGTTGWGRDAGATWLRIAEIDMIAGRWRQFCHGDNNVASETSLITLDNADASTAHQFITAHSDGVGANLSSVTTQTIHFGICLAELPAESYYSLNGYKNGTLVDVKYKTSTILNRSVYIGNIYDVTNSQTYGDRIMKTPQGKYDTFSTNFFIDVVPGDGDSIVKLESFADRLFVFKERTLYIVNVSQGSEFIEGEYQGMGVEKRHHVIKSEYGILWINQNGVFHFDGNRINNLSDNLIKSGWEDFFNTNSSIGYDLKSKHLIIDCDVKAGTSEDFSAFGLSSEDSNHGHALVYDFKVKAWTFLNGYFGADEDRSNMIISSNDQKLIWYQQSEGEAVSAYNDTSASQTIAIHTKDYDFGNPAARKKIYKVYVSYKGDGDQVTLQYAVNGDTDTVAPFYRTTADGTSDKTNSDTTPLLDSDTDDWIRAELRPVSSINNIFSFALRFGGTAEADFQINDITIVYRIKNIK